MPKADKKPTAKASRTVSTKQAAAGGAAKADKKLAPGKETKPTAAVPARRDGKAEDDASAAAAAAEDDDDNDNDGAVGFANAEAAAATVKATEALPRCLLYKYQRINTALTRATTHAHKTDGMREAAAVFKQWKENRYPELRAAQRAEGFRPPVPKDVMRKVLGRLAAAGLDTTFATFYAEQLEARAKLGNQLVEGDAAGRDWELVRYEALCRLVPKAKEGPKAWAAGELWDGSEPTKTHLAMLAWAWSPTPHRTLASRLKGEAAK